MDTLTTNTNLNTKAPEGFFSASHHARHRAVRAVATLVALGAITAFALSCAGHLHSFPQDFVHLATHWKGITVIASTAAALVIAGAIIGGIVMDPKNGKFSGHEHFKPVMGYYVKSDQTVVKWVGYKDTSVVKQHPKINSDHYNVFNYKYPIENEIIALNVFAFTPAVAAASIAWRAASIDLLPIYRLGVYLYQACTHAPERTYKLQDIPMAVASSIWGVVRTPFYMLALMMSAVYACIDPENGRKLGSLVEQKWNQGQLLHESIWSAPCVSAAGGCFLDPTFLKDVYYKVKHYGPQFTLPGCWQPVARIPTNTPTKAIEFSYSSVDSKGDYRSDKERQLEDLVYDGTDSANAS